MLTGFNCSNISRAVDKHGYWKTSNVIKQSKKMKETQFHYESFFWNFLSSFLKFGPQVSRYWSYNQNLWLINRCHNCVTQLVQFHNFEGVLKCAYINFSICVLYHSREIILTLEKKYWVNISNVFQMFMF